MCLEIGTLFTNYSTCPKVRTESKANEHRISDSRRSSAGAGHQPDEGQERDIERHDADRRGADGRRAGPGGDNQSALGGMDTSERLRRWREVGKLNDLVTVIWNALCDILIRLHMAEEVTE